MLKLVLRNLLRHPIRSILTMGSLAVALFLLCVLRSLVTSLESQVAAARSDRLWVQSAVSLFVDLPLSYPAKIAQVDGVLKTCNWQWFGGYFQDPGQFFAQFAVDEKEFLDVYPELKIVAGTKEAFLGNRTGCLVGKGLADQFEWKIGQTVPITGALFPHPEGADVPWEFQVEGIYVPTKPNFDDRTLFFHWDYFEKTLEGGELGSPGIGTIVIQTAPGVDQTRVMASIDDLFANGPQRVQTTTEAEFQAQFVSMYGNVPFFVSSIGGAVLVAILLACINTMLMAAREQTHDIGVMKALGFADRSMFAFLMVQSAVLSFFGGGLGLVGAKVTEPGIATVTATMLPSYRVTDETLLLGLVILVAISLFAGIVPAVRAGRMKCVDALGAVA